MCLVVASRNRKGKHVPETPRILPTKACGVPRGARLRLGGPIDGRFSCQWRNGERSAGRRFSARKLCRVRASGKDLACARPRLLGAVRKVAVVGLRLLIDWGRTSQTGVVRVRDVRPSRSGHSGRSYCSVGMGRKVGEHKKKKGEGNINHGAKSASGAPIGSGRGTRTLNACFSRWATRVAWGVVFRETQPRNAIEPTFTPTGTRHRASHETRFVVCGGSWACGTHTLEPPWWSLPLRPRRRLSCACVSF